MERPECPKGHKGRVTRDGWRYRKDRPELGKRQRWECFPGDPDEKSHKFIEPLPRLVRADHPPHCPHCATLLEKWEGQPSARYYGFTAQEIATALVDVAQGQSYRDTADSIRHATGRPLSVEQRTRQRTVGKKTKTFRVPAPNRHPQLVSDWVATHAGAVFRHYVAQETAAGLSGTVAIDAGGSGKGGSHSTAFQMLTVIAYRNDGTPFVAAVEASTRRTQKDWERVLSSLPFVPTRVVADRDAAGTNAAKSVWPDATVYACEWHLTNSLLALLPQATRWDDPIRKEIQGAVACRDEWNKLGRTLRSLRKKNNAWINVADTYEKLTPVIYGQVDSRTAVTTTGAVEHFLTATKRTLADRVTALTNAPKATALLQLLAAGNNRWAEAQQWAELLRDWLAQRDGTAPKQRAHTDKEGSPSLRKNARKKRPQTQKQTGQKKPRIPATDGQPRSTYIPSQVLATDPWPSAEQDSDLDAPPF